MTDKQPTQPTQAIPTTNELLQSRKSNSSGNAMQSCMAFLYRTITIERWIEKVVGEPIYNIDYSQVQTQPAVPQLLYSYLIDGVILCRLMSVIKPDSIPRIHPRGTLNFKIRENILFFLQALEELGISKFYQFQVNDLFEKKNFLKVLEALEILADYVASGSVSTYTTAGDNPTGKGGADQLASDEEAMIEFPDQMIQDVETLLKKANISQVKRQPLKKSLFVNEPKRLTLRNSVTPPTGTSSGSSFLRNSISSTGPNNNLTSALKPSAKPKILSEAQILEKAKPFTKIWIRVQSLVRGHLTRILYRKRVRMAAYRHKIVKELLQTEEVYVGNLEHLSKYYFAPIKKESTKLNIKLEHFTLQLSNLDVIINYNKKLLGMIQPKVQGWSNNQRIGDVFKQFTLYLKVYTQYVKEYNKIFDVINNYRKSNSKFEAFITEKEYNDPLKSIGTYLILPIQRIPRYTMLLENVVKNTWKDHADYDDLSESLKKMLDVASYVNEKTRDAENIVKVTEIQNNFIGKFDNLAEPHRRFVFEGPLNVLANGKESNRIFYLFNDFLIGTKPITSGLVKKKVQLKVKESIRLNLVSIRCPGESNEKPTENNTTTTSTTPIPTSINNSNNSNNNNNNSNNNSPSIVPSKPTPVTAKVKSTSSQSLLNISGSPTGSTLSASSPTVKPQSTLGFIPALSHSVGSTSNTTVSSGTPPLASSGMRPPKPAVPPRRDTLKQSPSSTPPLSSSSNNTNNNPTPLSSSVSSATPPPPPSSVSSATNSESSSATPPLLSIANKSHSTNSFSRVSSPLPGQGSGLTIGDSRSNQRVVSSPNPGQFNSKPNHGSYSSGSSGANSGSSSGSNSAHSTPKSMTPITASPSTSQEKLIDQFKSMSEEKKIAEEKRQVEHEKQLAKQSKQELMIELVDSFGAVILRLLCSSIKDKEHWVKLFKKVQEEIDTKKIVNDEANKRAQEKAGLAIAALSQQYATLRVKGNKVGLSTIKGMMSSVNAEDDDDEENKEGNNNSSNNNNEQQNTQLPGESNLQMYRRLTLARRTPNPTLAKESSDTSITGTNPTPIKSVPQSPSKEDLSVSSSSETEECSSPLSSIDKKDKKSSWFSSLRKKKTKTPSLQETFGHLDTTISTNTNTTTTTTPTSTVNPTITPAGTTNIPTPTVNPTTSQ